MSIRPSVLCQLALVLVLMASPATAQKKPSKASNEPTDPCAPIGRTEDGKLVYSLKCDRLPAAAQAGVTAVPAPQPPAEPETVRSGLFGLSYDRRPANGDAPPSANRPDNR